MLLKKMVYGGFIMKKILSLIMAGMLAVLSVACTNQQGDSNVVGGDSEEISLGLSPYPAFYIWYICEEEGLFDKYDLNVNLEYFPVYSDSLQAFATEQVDVLAMAMPDTVALFAEEIPFKLIFINENSNGADGLVANEGIETVADLKGKSVATEFGTIEHFFLLRTLESAGLTQDDITFVNLSIADSAPALISGSVDAASLWEPSLSLALTKEGSTLLTSSEDVPGLIPDGIVASDKMLTERSEDTKDLLNAYFDALAFYVENEDKAIADMAKGADITEEEMRISMSGSKLFSIQEAIDTMEGTTDDYLSYPYTVEVIAEFLKSVELIDEIPENLDDMIDASILKELLETRGSEPAPVTK